MFGKIQLCFARIPFELHLRIIGLSYYAPRWHSPKYNSVEWLSRGLVRISVDFVGRVTPVPIPNTEVKPASTPAALRRWGPRAGADGTARVTAWESRKSPGLLTKARSVFKLSGL